MNKKQRIIGVISILLIIIILAIIITTNIIINNNQVENARYLATTANVSSNLIASYIKKGITIGGITGTLEVLDTSDATATSEDILWGKTGYVKGIKITGTRIETVMQGKDWGGYFDKNTRILDELNNNVVIAEGFKIAQESATKVEDGVVIEDKSGNQFVWIPANTGGITIHTTIGDKTIKYTRHAYGFNIATGEIDNNTNSEKIKESSSINGFYTEPLPVDEADSINIYGGYYIGRFESGDKQSTESKVLRSESSSVNNTITIKKGQAPYNYATYSQQKSLAEGMKDEYNYKALTKICSSYAWDTAINFIEIKNANYGSEMKIGNFMDFSFTYTDIKGSTKTKNAGVKEIIPTGQTDPVSNIYDMGGNVWERSSENYSDANTPKSDRGGGANNEDKLYLAGIRNNYADKALYNNGFRVSLYIY